MDKGDKPDVFNDGSLDCVLGLTAVTLLFISVRHFKLFLALASFSVAADVWYLSVRHRGQLIQLLFILFLFLSLYVLLIVDLKNTFGKKCQKWKQIIIFRCMKTVIKFKILQWRATFNHLDVGCCRAGRIQSCCPWYYPQESHLHSCWELTDCCTQNLSN